MKETDAKTHFRCSGCGALTPSAWIANGTNGAKRIGNLSFCSGNTAGSCENKYFAQGTHGHAFVSQRRMA